MPMRDSSKPLQMRRLFGTDGVRGTANTEPMTAETVLKLAMAAGLVLRRGDHRHLVVIGKDTRLSGYRLEPAVTSGFIAMGMDVVLVGPLPTPAIAMLTRSLRADLGVMISASHNPFEDNGIKFFGPDGYKLSDEIEAQIEAGTERAAAQRAPSAALGRAKRLDDAGGRYIEFVKGSFPRGLRLDGLKVVVDCAHGAAYKVAPTVLWELGAEVIPLGVSPDGHNINREAGTVATAAMQREVTAQRADRAQMAQRRHARRRRRGGDGDVESGLRALPPRPSHRAHPHRRRRPLRGRGDAPPRRQSRRRAVGPHRPQRLFDDGRRLDGCAASAGGDRRFRQAGERSRQGFRAGAA